MQNDSQSRSSLIDCGCYVFHHISKTINIYIYLFINKISTEVENCVDQSMSGLDISPIGSGCLCSIPQQKSVQNKSIYICLFVMVHDGFDLFSFFSPILSNQK